MATSGEAQVPFKVEGKRAWISGAGSGINYHLAKQLLERNCSVLIADIALRPEAQDLVTKYSSGTPRCVYQKTDVTSWKQLQNSIQKTITEFGGIDIVGPGAGVFEEPWSNFWIPPGESPSRDTLDKSSYATLDINITHPIRATQVAISEFLNPTSGKDADKASLQNPKRVIHTSSIAGQAFGIPFPLYFTSKHAVSAFVRSLGDLDRLGIRVNCVAPGVVKTPLWTEHPEKLKIFEEGTDTWVTPEEVAEQMIRLMEDPELPGGTILEVLHESQRVVPAFGNPGPGADGGVGVSTSKGEAAGVEAFERVTRKGWGKL